MRNSRMIAAAVLSAAALLLTGCGADECIAPPVEETTVAAKEDARTNPFHWELPNNRVVLDSVESLRRGVEGLGFALLEADYAPIGEYIDNPDNPQALVTLWLSPKGDTAVELHSSLGFMAVTVRKEGGTVKIAGSNWVRCEIKSVEQRTQSNPAEEAARIATLSRQQLEQSGCEEVVWGK